MKTLTKNAALLAIFSIFCMTLPGCKDDEPESDIVRIQSVVPQGIIDDLRNKGMTITEGVNPPPLENAFIVSPMQLKEPYGPNDSYARGKIIDDEYYKFYDQNSNNEIKYDYHDEDNNEFGTGKGAFIAGEGNKFTIFSEDNGTSSGISVKMVSVISGELTSDGIKNFQFAFVLKEKGDDPNNTLIPENTGRIWIDGDFMTETTDNFRKSALAKSTPGGSIFSTN